MMRIRIGTAALLPALLLSLAASAQSASETRREAMRACAALESVEARVACIERMLAGEGGNEAPPAADADREARSDDEAGGDAAPGRSAEQAQRPGRRPDPREESEGDGERSVVVVEVRTRIPGRAVFITEAGERFVQSTGRSRLFLPSTPFDAVVRPAAMGSRFLIPDGHGRAIRVSTE